MTHEERKFYVTEIERLRDENRRLIASEAALRAKHQVVGQQIRRLAQEARDDLLRIASRQ